MENCIQIVMGLRACVRLFSEILLVPQFRLEGKFITARILFQFFVMSFWINCACNMP